MSRDMVWLSGLLAYKQAEIVFERIGHCTVPMTAIWRNNQIHGERIRAYLERERERVKPERVILPPPGQDHACPKGISIDGGMVNICEEGWKEIKVGAVFDIEERLDRDPITGERGPQAHGVNVGYAAVLGTVEDFGPEIWRVAVEQEVPQAAKSSVTADGAEWIWNLVADYFPESEQIVDWYHACEHLHQAATALFVEDEKRAERWYKKRQENLYLGEVHMITNPLDQAGLSKRSHYFHNHQRRMRYQDYREEGYPIGSGIVESGIKQFKVRLSGPGMRWSREGAERMLAIRGAVLDHSFDDVWAIA